MTTELDNDIAISLKEPKLFKVILLNDDKTPMDFVIAVLQEIFNKSGQDAVQLMLDVHVRGRGVAGIYTEEIANSKKLEVDRVANIYGHPLQTIVEPE